jgi:hypothetical protein
MTSEASVDGALAKGRDHQRYILGRRRVRIYHPGDRQGLGET